jgi:hypothetical protein
MAGVIAHGKKDRFVLTFCLGKGLFSLGIPINGIVRMQEEVRTLFVDQAIGVAIVAWFL